MHLTEARNGMNEKNPIISRGISAQTWRIYVHVWLVCLIFPILSLVQSRLTLPHLITAAAGLIVFCAFYTWYMRPYPLEMSDSMDSRQSQSLLAILLAVVLILALSAIYGSAFLWLLVGASAVGGKTQPIRTAHLITGGLPLLAIGTSVILGGGIATTDWMHILPLALLIRVLGLDMIGLSQLTGTIRELHTAREELAHQAIIAERLRLARDLHDLLGHTLSLIALKSELVGRLIEKKPTQALTEIHELETVARQALREVRQAVAGYRQPTLAAELEGAQQMLAAAGIDCVIPVAVGTFPLAIDAVLAWTVREGVTNIIRHSRAHVCTIRIASENGTIQAEVTNDGCSESEMRSPVKRGSGLSGLAERVAGQGGIVEAVPSLVSGIQSFRLRVEIPAADKGMEYSS